MHGITLWEGRVAVTPAATVGIPRRTVGTAQQARPSSRVTRLSGEAPIAAAFAESRDDLLHSLRLLEVILGVVADGVTAHDVTGRLVYVNAAAARMSGYPSPEEMMAAPPGDYLRRFELLDDSGQPFPLERLPGRLAAQGAECPRAVIQYRNRATAEERWSEVEARPVRDAGGNVAFVVNVVRDVTHLIRQQQEVEHQARSLEIQTEEAQTLSEDLAFANERLEEALRKAQEEKLRAVEALARFQGVFNSRLVGLTVFDAASGRTLAINDYLLDLIGYTREEFERGDVDWPSVTAPEYLDAELRLVRQLLEHGFAGPFEKEYVRRDGTRVPALLASGAIEGLPGQFAVFVQDLTQQKRIERDRERLFAAEKEAREEAQRSSRRLAFLARASARLAASLEYEPTLQMVAQLAVPEVADWCFVELLENDGSIRSVAVAHRDPEKVALARESLRRNPIDPNAPHGTAKVLRTGQPEIMEQITDELLRAVAQDEEHLRIMLAVGLRSAISVPLAVGGAPFGVLSLVWAESGRAVTDADVSLAQDLAHRAATAITNAKLYASVRAANAAKSDFLATMSHELRTPLNAILGYADLLEMELAGPLTTEQREQLDRIRWSGRHLVELVNDVLDLAKIEAGGLRPRSMPARADAAVSAALQGVRPQAQAAGIAIAQECEGEAAAMYRGDEHRVRQVLLNLLSNAVKFTPRGGRVSVHCRTSTSPPEEATLPSGQRWVALEVRDTGIGIASHDLEQIFEPFVQVSQGPTRTHGGTGLGLTISRQLARLMDGDITVQSVPGEGSTFTLWLSAADQ